MGRSGSKIKAILISIISVAVFSTAFTFLYINEYKPFISRQQISIDEFYSKYEGEKISLNTTETCQTGVWGSIELISSIIQPCEEYIVNQINRYDLYEQFNSSRQWVFNDMKLENIKQLFLDGGLDEAVCSRLLQSTSPISGGKGYITTLPDEILNSFTPETRARLYNLIGDCSGNGMYGQPVYFCSGNPEEWFYQSSLSEKQIEKLLSLVYVKNGVSYISDIHLVLPLIAEDELVGFIQTIFRSKTVDCQLIIEEGQDVSGLVNYWGGPDDARSVEDTLEKLSQKTGGGKISISELLPVIPQNRLDTYVGLDEFEADWKDCHWTTINFFNHRVDESYYNSPDTFSYLCKLSKPIKAEEMKFGDIVSVFDENNILVHSCIYIADNLVMTKNGMGNLMPFVISYLDKTVSIYGEKTVCLSRTAVEI